MDWILYGTVVVVGAIAVLCIYSLAGKFHAAHQIRRLATQDRILPWETAVERTRRGEGFFVIEKNGRSLVWWLQGSIIGNPFHLYTAVRERGLLVQPEFQESHWRALEQEGLATAVKELVGHFMIDHE